VLVRDTGEEIGHLEGNNALDSLKLGNRTLDTDLYELTMAAGYFMSGKGEQRACFDLYYRQNPDGGGFCIFAGLESVIDYVNRLKLYPDDLQYLASLGIFSEETLKHSAWESSSPAIYGQFPKGQWSFPMNRSYG
jgi:nicotinate phosphoribosyltransferase